MNLYDRFIYKAGKISYILSAAFLIAALLVNLVPPAPAFASAGAIWTTGTTCIQPDPQDDNLYAVGDTVYIRGSNFEPDSDLVWEITQVSGPDKTLIEDGVGTTDSTGYFCVTSHTILPGESGTFTVDVTATGDTTKNDNYRVNDASSGLTLEKSGLLDLGSNGTLNPGDLINYTLVVTNTGTVNLTDLVVTDVLLGTTVNCGGIPQNEISRLNKNNSTTCTGYYAVTQADIDAGFVYNIASASTGDLIAYGDTTVDLPTSYSISLVKTGVLNGDNIDYTFTVTNTGTGTLTNIVVTDLKLGAGYSCLIASLAPGASDNSCTGSYPYDEADLLAGKVDNTGTATAGIISSNDDETVLFPDVCNNIAGAQLMVPVGLIDDNGACVPEPVPGCMDDTFDNFNPNATVDDGSCANDPIPGCMDDTFDNFNPNATVDDGSCTNDLVDPIPGCTNPAARNFNPAATVDDGSCSYPENKVQVLIPVTGVADGAGRFGSQGLFLASIAFFGFGLVLSGVSRKREE
jgi:uncharacterized repeat protein (TIGR01451 family)